MKENYVGEINRPKNVEEEEEEIRGGKVGQ